MKGWRPALQTKTNHNHQPKQRRLQSISFIHIKKEMKQKSLSRDKIEYVDEKDEKESKDRHGMN